MICRWFRLLFPDAKPVQALVILPDLLEKNIFYFILSNCYFYPFLHVRQRSIVPLIQKYHISLHSLYSHLFASWQTSRLVILLNPDPLSWPLKTLLSVCCWGESIHDHQPKCTQGEWIHEIVWSSQRGQVVHDFYSADSLSWKDIFLMCKEVNVFENPVSSAAKPIKSNLTIFLVKCTGEKPCWLFICKLIFPSHF